MEEYLINIKTDWEDLKQTWKDEYIYKFETGCIDVIFDTLDKMIINSEMFNDEIKTMLQEIAKLRLEILKQ